MSEDPALTAHYARQAARVGVAIVELVVEPPPPDPIDVGALLRAALALSGLSAADVGRATGIAQPHVSRALRSPNTRPTTARRILAACGARVSVSRQTAAEPVTGRCRVRPQV